MNLLPCQREPATPLAGPLPPPIVAACGAARRRDACVGDWRNRLVQPLLRASGVAVAPTFAALAGRAELHTGDTSDCTHWCDGSEASVQLASSVLNTVAALLSSRRGRAHEHNATARRAEAAE